MDTAVVTVYGDQRLAAVEAEMQVVTDQPQRQERNTCDQCYDKAMAVGGTHWPRLAEIVLETLPRLERTSHFPSVASFWLATVTVHQQVRGRNDKQRE